MDFTSLKYPFVSKYFSETEEGHDDSLSENVMSNVVGYEHPLLSATQLKNTINHNRSLGNTTEELLSGEIKEKVLKDIINVAYKEKFPLEPLIYLLDVIQPLDKRSSASDAKSVVTKVKSHVDGLKSSLGRQPYNSEVMMAYLLDSVSKAKKLIDEAKSNPNEIAKPAGSKYDSIIFYKQRLGEKAQRKNKEVLQFFNKRMQLGSDVFPHLPFKQGIGNVS